MISFTTFTHSGPLRDHHDTSNWLLTQEKTFTIGLTRWKANKFKDMEKYKYFTVIRKCLFVFETFFMKTYVTNWLWKTPYNKLYWHLLAIESENLAHKNIFCGLRSTFHKKSNYI